MLAYIGGEYDGLLLRNYLKSSLLNLDIYDKNSNIEIQAQATVQIYILQILIILQIERK